MNVDWAGAQEGQVFLIPTHPSDASYQSDSWQYDLTQAMKEFLYTEDSHAEDALVILEGLIFDLELPGFRSLHIMNLMLRESGNDRHSVDLRERVMKILQSIFRCVNNEKLFHYFIPKLNLFPALNREEQRHALGKLDELLKNPSHIFAMLVLDGSCHV